ncbi:MAG: heavy metal translocating P-type ATPase metal-binding domain-containing protein [Cyclobacteriaceae bacterium]|nr:heavy metal translocating P-type ATPase metal-binding domain-containing protein [Cyclobacteriaceae bacterium]
MQQTEKALIDSTVCFHCGNDCVNKPIRFQEKYFCCTGCKMVFEILAENDLYEYYDLSESPGVKINIEKEDKYAFLDNTEITSSLFQFSSDEINKVVLFIPGIHCSSCIWLLENLQKLHRGVKSVQVNFTRKEAAISFGPDEISFRELAVLLESIGYPPLINWAGTKNEKKDQSLYIKLGVAAFCFGNVMLLSFPEYLGIQDWQDNAFRKFFSLLNLVLAIPVVFYSGFDYFTSAFKSFRARYISIDVPIALGIAALFLRSTWEVLSQTGPGFFDSLTGLIFFLLIGRWFQSMTYESLAFDRDYKSYFPLAVTRLRGNEKESVMIKDIMKGDDMLVRNNEIVPADALLVSDTASIDYSFVTGESTPVLKKSGDLIYAGGKQMGQAIKLTAIKTASQSYLLRLWEKDDDRKSEQTTPSQQIINQVSKYFTMIIIAIALVSGLFWYTKDPGRMWEIMTAVLIVACPCALALCVPFTYGNIIRVLGRNGLYLSAAGIVEKFNKINHVIFDKTGTITLPDGGEINYVGQPLNQTQQSIVKAIAEASVHPLSKKVAAYFPPEARYINLDHFEELSGQGIQAEKDGSTYLLGSGKFAAPTVNDLDQHVGTAVYLSIDNQFIGVFKIKTTYQPALSQVLTKLHNNFKLSLLSGDHDHEKNTLINLFGKWHHLKFKFGPDEKEQFVLRCTNQGDSVLMVGDGLNDAAALKASHLGIAVTQNVATFSPACDGILEGKSFHKLPLLIRFVRSGRYFVIAGFIISFLYNIIGLGFAISGHLTPVFAAILMPLSSITIVAFATLSINFISKIKHLN